MMALALNITNEGWYAIKQSNKNKPALCSVYIIDPYGQKFTFVHSYQLTVFPQSVVTALVPIQFKAE